MRFAQKNFWKILITNFTIIFLSYSGLYLGWLFSYNLAPIANALLTMICGITGFAIGTMIFWKIVVKISRQQL